MPQLDGYLIFSEIFWFTILFGLGYIVVYRAVAKLHLGLRTRWAFIGDSADFGTDYRVEQKEVSVWQLSIEKNMMDLAGTESLLSSQVTLLQNQLKAIKVKPARHRFRMKDPEWFGESTLEEYPLDRRIGNCEGVWAVCHNPEEYDPANQPPPPKYDWSTT